MVGDMATAKTYTIRVNVVGSDKASKPLNKFGGSLLSLRNIIGGILGANLLLALGRQIAGLGKDALNAVATYEQMGFTLQTLIARELARGETLTRVSTQVRALTAQEKLRVITLGASYQTLTTSLADVTESYNDSIIKSGENSEASLRLQIRLEGLTTQIAVTASELGALSNIETVGLKTLESYTIGTMSMGEALRAALPQAKEMIRWVENLAIASPFDMNGVTIALRTALAYGMNLDMAKRLTQATVDFAAASSLSGETLTRIARAMGQVQGKGRLMAEEVRQMADAGLPVLEIMAKSYGKTTIEIQALMRKGLIPAHDAINAITESLEKDFAGAAERQLETWNGIRNSMGDIKVMGLQRVFVGVADAFKPFFGQFIQFMRDEGFDKLQKFGDTFGKKFGDRVTELSIKFSSLRATFRLLQLGFTEGALKKLGAPQYVIDSVDSLKESWGNIRDWWDENKGPLSEAIGNVFTAIFKPEGGGELGETLWNAAVKGFESLGNFFENDNGQLVANINALADAIGKNLHPALKNFGDWVGERGIKIKEFGISLGLIFGVPLLASKVSTLGIAFGATGLGGALTALASVPFITLVGGLAGVALAISAAYWALSSDRIPEWSRWKEVWEALPLFFSIKKEELSIAIGEINQVFVDLWAGMLQNWIDFTVELETTWPTIWISLKEGASLIWADFLLWFDQAMVDILIWIQELAPEWVTAGSSMLQGLWDGLKAKWVEIYAWLKEVANLAIGLWNKIWGMKSPSTVMFDSGKNIMAGLMQGLESMKDLPGIHMKNTMTSMMDPVPSINAMSDFLPSSVANNNQSETTSTVTKIEKMIFDFKDTTLTKRELEKTLTQLGLLNAVG